MNDLISIGSCAFWLPTATLSSSQKTTSYCQLVMNVHAGDTFGFPLGLGQDGQKHIR